MDHYQLEIDQFNCPVADPVKTSQKKMATVPQRKFRESLHLPLGQISGSATGGWETFSTRDLAQS